MPNTISQKLKINAGDTLLTINEPPEFQKGLKGLPEGVKVVESGKDYNQVHWFVLNRAQMESQMSRIMKLVKPGITIWVYYPKGTSKLQTDLNRDKGWDCLLAEADKLRPAEGLALVDELGRKQRRVSCAGRSQRGTQRGGFRRRGNRLGGG